MLHCENGGRNEQSNLLARENSLECGAQSDLGLSEADIAAKKPVHGNSLFHISLDLGYGGQLRVGLLVFKSGVKLVLELVCRGECVARQPLPFGVEPYELLGYIRSCGGRA